MSLIDTTDPTVSLSVASKAGPTAHVAATASDNDAVTRVDWFANGVPVLTRTPAQGLSGTIDKHVGLTVGTVAAFAAAVPTVAVATDPDAAVTCAVSGAMTIANAACAAPLPADPPDGSYTYTDTATDDVGNVAVVSRTFRLDRTPPVIAGLGGPPEGGEVATRSVTMTFDVSDANLDRVTCALDGGAATPCAASKTLSGLAPGTHRFTLTATDKAGNTTHRTRASGGQPGPPGAPRRAAREVHPAHAAAGQARRDGFEDHRPLHRPRLPAHAARLMATHGTVRLTSLQGRAFRAGAVLTIRIAEPGLRTETMTVRIRKGARPKVS